MVKKSFGLPDYLTRRDAAANTFEDVFNLTVPRADAPRNLGAAPTVARDEWGDEVATVDDIKNKLAAGAISSAPVSELQANLVEAARAMPVQPDDRIARLDHARPIVTEHDAAVYLRQNAERIRQMRHNRSQ
jgi:hypothetical protein